MFQKARHQLLLYISLLLYVSADGKIFKQKVRLPAKNVAVCSYSNLVQIVSTCVPTGVEILYNHFIQRFPDGCMKPFPREFFLSVARNGLADSVDDEELKEVINRAAGKGGQKNTPGESGGGKGGGGGKTKRAVNELKRNIKELESLISQSKHLLLPAVKLLNPFNTKEKRERIKRNLGEEIEGIYQKYVRPVERVGYEWPSVREFLKRRFIADESLCGSDGLASISKKLLSLKTMDELTAFSPMLGYMKNSFIRKYFVKGRLLYNKLVDDFEISEKILNETEALQFAEFPRHVKTFCSFASGMGACMNSAVKSSDSACGRRWGDIGQWLDSLPKGLCVENGNGVLVPNGAVLKVLESNFAYLFNFMDCFVKTKDDELEELRKIMPRAYDQCGVEPVGQRSISKVRIFTKYKHRKPVDVMETVEFIQNFTGSFAPVIRCFAKHFHKTCARSQVDLGLSISQMLPVIELATFGVVSLPVSMADYRIQQSFKSSDRVTVMVVGDPHIQTLKNQKFETCSELQHYTQFDSDGEKSVQTDLIADKKVNILTNDYMKVEGTLARWSVHANGTYFKEVKVKTLFLFGKDGDNEEGRYMEYSYHKDVKNELNPTFSSYRTRRESTTKLNLTEFETNTDPPAKLQISTKTVAGEKKVVLKEKMSGTVVTLSNPSRDMVNVYIRSSRQLLQLSSGLLIDGCFDKTNRSKLIKEVKEKKRGKRSLDCTASCAGLPANLQEMCEFDCSVADSSGVSQSLGLNVYNEIGDLSTDVETEDSSLISEAIEEPDIQTVSTTTPSPDDMEASGGNLPGLEFERSLEQAIYEGTLTAPSNAVSLTTFRKSANMAACTILVVLSVSVMSRR